MKQFRYLAVPYKLRTLLVVFCGGKLLRSFCHSGMIKLVFARDRSGDAIHYADRTRLRLETHRLELRSQQR